MTENKQSQESTTQWKRPYRKEEREDKDLSGDKE